MPSRRRFSPVILPLEQRLALSAFPSNVISSEIGNVPFPGAVGQTTTTVQPRNLTPGRPRGTLLGLAAGPTPGSTLAPRIVAARDALGHRLPLSPSGSFKPGLAPARAFVRVFQPGPFNTGVTGQHGTTGTYQADTRLVGDLNGDGVVNLDDLALFPETFRTRAGDPNFNPNADANMNGQIGIFDGKALVRNLAPPGPPRPLDVVIHLAPEDNFQGKGPVNSGGVTLHKNVTVVGRTTPGSIVFTDSGLGDYTFAGKAIATDAQGFFSVQLENKDGINQQQFLIIDPYGQHTIQDFPIYWMNFRNEGD